MRIQKPVKGRKHMGAGMIREIRERIERIARDHDVSKSFVINVILADALGIRKQERY